MKLTGLHLLLTYACTLECDHCFVWSSPWQSGVMTLKDLREIVRQAGEPETIEWIYFEGGEPFLHYAVLVQGVRMAAEAGFKVGIVSNGYWATDVEVATEYLRPLAGLVQDLSISCDDYHGGADAGGEPAYARAAAEGLGMPTGNITIAQPETANAVKSSGQLPAGESRVLYRGRAADLLTPRARTQHWTAFQSCSPENLRDPGRVHVDPFGYVHLCQGLCIGNMFKTSLREICETYDADAHPIAGPLLRGGPAQLAREHAVPHEERYADECHFCYDLRRTLRRRFPEILAPDQMYGAVT